MRPRGALSLAEPIRLPSVQLNREESGTTLTADTIRTQSVERDSTLTTELNQIEVTARTVETSDVGKDDYTDIPEYRRATKKTQSGQREITVTPVVELVHRGELSVVDRQMR
jgi:hypothetical protein